MRLLLLSHFAVTPEPKWSRLFFAESLVFDGAEDLEEHLSHFQDELNIRQFQDLVLSVNWVVTVQCLSVSSNLGRS